MSNPTFVLPEYYTSLLTTLTTLGHPIQALHLPSVGLSTLQGRPGPPPTMFYDAAFIATTLTDIADQGKHIILLAHSYGGVPATQSTLGLTLAERKAQGKPGGVVEISYMTCLVPPLGVSAAGLMEDVPAEGKLEMVMDEPGWLYHSNPAATAAITLSSLPPAEGEAWIRKFPKHSAVSYAGELTHAGYIDVPMSYLVCEQDLSIPIAAQMKGIKMVERTSGRRVTVKRIGADHCPQVVEQVRAREME